MASNHNVVPQAWREGRPASAGSLHTDGQRIYSYGLCIGTTTKDGRKVAIKVHASVTTSRHVGGASSVAHETVPANGHQAYRCDSVCEHIRALEA